MELVHFPKRGDIQSTPILKDHRRRLFSCPKIMHRSRHILSLNGNFDRSKHCEALILGDETASRTGWNAVLCCCKNGFVLVVVARGLFQGKAFPSKVFRCQFIVLVVERERRKLCFVLFTYNIDEKRDDSDAKERLWSLEYL